MNHFPRAWDTQTSRDLAPEKSCCSRHLCYADDRSCRALYVAAEFYSVLCLIYLSIWLQKYDEYMASAHAHRDVGSNYSVSYLGPY